MCGVGHVEATVVKRMAAMAALAVSLTTEPDAQGLGTFRWQLRPFCNLVTLNVRQEGGLYTLDGFDDQCGAAERGGVVGTAFLNPDGSIGLSLAMVGAPAAAPAMLQARLELATVSGTWTDSAGNGGAFVFTPGARTPGPARPVPPNGIRPASVTSAQLAPGAVGAAQIALGAITAAQLAPGAVGAAQIANGSITAAKLAPGAVQVPIVGTCPVGQYLRGVTAAGNVICEPFFVPAVSMTVDDQVNLVGYFTSVAIGADGLPVISYHDATAGALRVTKCGNASCTAGNVSTTVDDPANTVGLYSSIAIGTDGLPVISYQDFTAQSLRVTKCGNAACTAGNGRITVDDPANTVGLYSSIAIGADGLPVISHHDVTAGALRVTKCGNAACTSGNVSTTVDDQANHVGWDTSIAIGLDGLPVISHGDITAGVLRVTKCGNAACTSGNVSTTVDDPANHVGGDSSIAIGADGLPVISHRDQTASALRVTKCGNAACTAGNVSTTVDDPADLIVGGYSSIAIGPDGLPVIAYRDNTALALRVTKCGNPACTAGNVSTTVDDPATSAVGVYISLAIGADGLPVISHLDDTVDALRVTKCGTRSCR
jgi:hypothetical protein